MTVLVLLGIGGLFFCGPVKRDVRDTPTEEYRFQVDLNKASAIELQTLPGIGEKLSEGILRYREENGEFRIPNDIMKVKGIGPKKREVLEPYLLDVDRSGPH